MASSFCNQPIQTWNQLQQILKSLFIEITETSRSNLTAAIHPDNILLYCKNARDTVLLEAINPKSGFLVLRHICNTHLTPTLQKFLQFNGHL
jgi:hypothetical protein